MKIPFVDLRAQYLAHREDFDRAIQSVIDKTAFVGGDDVRQFESDFALASGAKYCVSCANGTDAIYASLKMLGIGPGDEVITTAMSWISTSETITQTGATPVFVDVDENYGLDPVAAAAKVTKRTKAIVPVHLYGQPAAMTELVKLASSFELKIVEDCAQAHLANHHGQPVGTLGVAGTFSFYPGKNLGAYGDAGAVVTNDEALAQRIRMYVNHGALVKHEHQIEGINSRLDGIQAALLSAKLKYLRQWTARRQEIAMRYTESLAAIEQVIVPKIREKCSHVWHLFVVQVEKRDELREYLRSRGIDCQIHYPRALPFLPAYQRFAATHADYPVAHHMMSRILSLPLYPEMTPEQVDFVTSTIQSFYRSAK